MRVLFINKFFYVKGGPERYMFNVAAMLQKSGHETAFFSMEHEKNAQTPWNKYFVSNVEYHKKLSLRDSVGSAFRTLYSFEARAKLDKLLDEFKPDVAHLQNYHHQLSPSILHSLAKHNVPVVAKLPDYKMVCPAYVLCNHGKVCDACKNRRFYQCFLRKCHKDSYAKSLLVTLESYLHHFILHPYKAIGCYIAPSRFLMDKMREMGLKGKIVHLPNFVNCEEFNCFPTAERTGIIYWGAIARIKGIFTLLDAVANTPVDLVLVGDGPDKEAVKKVISEKKFTNVSLADSLFGDALKARIRAAKAAVLPSEWYENNPNSVLEAFAMGMPVVGSRIGGIPELVKDNITGLTFTPGDSADLRSKIMFLVEHPEKASEMGKNAREMVLNEYNPEGHFDRLMEIYKDAIAAKKKGS